MAMNEGALHPELVRQLGETQIDKLRERILRWYVTNRRDLPWRRTTDPYAILVSEFMLQQTQVSRVVPRFEIWLATYPTLESLAQAPLADVLRLWSGLGYNNRARRLRDCALATIATTAGRRAPRAAALLPRALDDLLQLPGIGPYTARALLVFAHNDNLAAVDANVRRVLLHELSLDQALPERTLQHVAEAVLPRGHSRDWHNALMDYGALELTSGKTGIAARHRQSAFEGSRRQQRARIVRHILTAGPRRIDQISATLDLRVATTADLVDALARDGLLKRQGDMVAVA
jgi:A/G-specific adenine glycosylase